ncbi:MAG: hypothetical protein ACRC8S_17555 [Fimbriiglobus sp.]
MPVDPEIYATTECKMTEAELQVLSDHLAEQVDRTQFSHYFTGRGVIERVALGEYDILSDYLPRTACILRVRLERAFYGPGYERGYWPVIAAVLEFLRRRIPESQVWYGPDCGDWVDQMTPEALDKLWSHWATHGGRPYYRDRNSTP